MSIYRSAPSAFAVQSQIAAETFARQAALMLGYLQQLHSERVTRRREQQVAAALQRFLLPTLPDIEGISCAARYLVSTDHAQVGGDWYDVFHLPDGAIGLAVGDVMDRDLAAAAAMGQLRSVLPSYPYEGSSPSAVLDRLDRLVQGFEMAEVATAIYGHLLLHAGTALLVFAYAGPLPLLLRNPDGSVYRLHRGASPLIGALPPGMARPRRGRRGLARGSLLLYTDGWSRPDLDVDQGIDRLCATLATLDPSTGPDHVWDAVIAELFGVEQDDDIALLAMQIDPHPS